MTKNPESTHCIEPARSGEASLRLSIQPTYDSRKTGKRFSVETFVSGKFLSRTELQDPFVRHTVKVGLWDSLRLLLRSGTVIVRINIDGDSDIMEDVLELDANYIGHGNTRRQEWRSSLETSLKEFAE